MCFQQEKKLTVVSGVIQQIQTRSVSGGTKTAYDIYVNGQKYGAGLFAPKAKEGDYVTSRLTRTGMAGTQWHAPCV